MEILVLIFLVVGCSIYFSHAKKKKRREKLLEKYGDPSIVEKIMKRMFWQGQTAEQLRDSLGAPEDIDSKVMKTRSRHVWKYHSTGKNRYGLRITLDDGCVVGWDQK